MVGGGLSDVERDHGSPLAARDRRREVAGDLDAQPGMSGCASVNEERGMIEA
jgi:hypothetical protein